MAQLFSGDCIGRVVNPEFGMDANNRPRVRWEMEVVEGEHKGKRAAYSGKLDPDNIKFTKRDMIAVGWKGTDVRTFVDDVKAKGNQPVPFVAEIAEHNGRQWTSAKMTGALPLAKPDDRKVDEVNQWFAEAGEAGSNDDRIPF